MEIFLNILFLIVGLALLIYGAEFFVSGASAIAKKLRVSAMIIGLTVVAIGTSLPELAVSISSAISGVTDLSIGNIVGSNMFNMLICLGVVAMFAPVKMKQSTKKIDFPFLITLTSILLIFSIDKYLDGLTFSFLSRTESILLLVILVLYMYVTISNARRTRKIFTPQENTLNLPEGEAVQKTEVKVKELKIWQIILYVLGGIGAVIFGGECVSSTSQFLALKMGMSEALVGLTIVAISTSLPEFVTSIVAAKKGENEIALGNVIGSNIMNIALILGSVGVITQINISTSMIIDLLILFVSTIIFILMCLRKNELRKKEGFFLIAIYVMYIAFAIVRNYCF